MKRLHVHIAVKDLEVSVRFYSRLLSAAPSVRKADYAKWMLDDPRVNLAISQRGAAPGIDHLGIQVEDRRELEDVYARLTAAEAPTIEEGEKVCCYARSEKTWIADPQGVQWETFLTTGESTTYGTDQITPKQLRQAQTVESSDARSCCAPKTA